MFETLEQELIERLDLAAWEQAEPKERQTILREHFAFVCERCDVSAKLSFEMPEDFATAQGLYDAASKTLFLNAELWPLLAATDPLFLLLHELRHLLQAKYPDAFNEAIRLNAVYVLQYDGTAYKLEDGEYRAVKLDGDPKDFLQLYLASPAERDANLFAHRILKAAGGGADVDRRLAMFSPEEHFFAEGEAEKAFVRAVREIDRLLAAETQL